MRRVLLAAASLVSILVGLLWVLQGLGVVHWPRQSFMIAQTNWAIYGALLMALGLVLLYRARQR